VGGRGFGRDGEAFAPNLFTVFAVIACPTTLVDHGFRRFADQRA
jgi:hypothetical protein